MADTTRTSDADLSLRLVPKTLTRHASGGYWTTVYAVASDGVQLPARYLISYDADDGKRPHPPEHLDFTAEFGRGFWCLVFTDDAYSDSRLRELARHWNKALPLNVDRDFPVCSWMPRWRGPMVDVRADWKARMNDGTIAIATDAELAIGTFKLTLRTGTKLHLDGSSVVFAQDAQLDCVGPVDRTTGAGRPVPTIATAAPRIDLAARDAGRIEARIGLSLDRLTEVAGAEFRVALQDGGLRYPLLRGGADQEVDFTLSWNVAAPLDPHRTYFAIDPVAGVGLPTFYQTPEGKPLTLVAAAVEDAPPAGFAFALSRPTVLKRHGKDAFFTEFGAAEPHHYLTPSGPFHVRETGDAEDANKPVAVMSGISGADYLLLNRGDCLCFLADHETADGSSSDWSTAWVKVIPDSDATPALNAGFCSQQRGMTFFENRPGFADPVGARVADLSYDGDHLDTAFPLFPYGGLYTTQPVTVDGGTQPAAVNANHALGQILGGGSHPSVRQILSAFSETDGPVFFGGGGKKLSGLVRTEAGLLADLNAGETAAGEGTVKRFFLAKAAEPGADGTPSYLTINPGREGVVDATLTSALVANADLVIATDDRLISQGRPKGFGNRITMGSFAFDLRLGDGQGIMLGKFAAGRSLEALLDDAKTHHPAHFLSDETLDDVLARIARAFDTARRSQAADSKPEGSPGSTRHKPAFGHFLRIISDPDWTGILVLDCPLDYSSLPPDVFTIMGGIPDRVPAHHLGVSINRPRPGAPLDPIETSSLFAVIYYENAIIQAAPDYETGLADWRRRKTDVYNSLKPANGIGFETLRLEVLFENSKQQYFQTRLALTLPELLGAPVQLRPDSAPPQIDVVEADTMVIDGRQIRHPDKTFSLVFEWPKDRYFDIVKDDGQTGVPRSLKLRDVHLRPIAAVATDAKTGTSTGVSVFEFQADLAFTAPPALADDGGKVQFDSSHLLGDVFSFDPLALDAYGIQVKTVSPKQGNNQQFFVEDLEGTRISSPESEARTGSLCASLPLSPSAIRRIEDWTATARKGWWVKGNVAPGLPEVVPSDPGYAVEFDFPMGKTGGQKKTAGEVTGRLLLAWSPAGEAGSDTRGIWFGMQSDNMNLQGVMKTSFDEVRIVREGPVYALRLENYRIHVFSHSLPANPSAMVMKAGGQGKLAWVLVPNAAEDDDDGDGQTSGAGKFGGGIVGGTTGDEHSGIGKFSGGLMYSPVYISRGKLKEIEPVNKTNYIADAIEELIGSPLEPKPASEDDAGAGDDLVVAIQILLPNIDVKFLMQDNTFYGGRLELRAEPSKVDKKDDSKIGRFLLNHPTIVGAGWCQNPAIQRVWKKLNGAELELYYKHLETGVGVYSVNMVLPEPVEDEDEEELSELHGSLEKSKADFDKGMETRKKAVEEASSRVSANAAKAEALRKRIALQKEELKAKRKELNDLKTRINNEHRPTVKPGRQDHKTAAITKFEKSREEYHSKAADLDAAQKQHDLDKKDAHRTERKQSDLEMDKARLANAVDLLEMAFAFRSLELEEEKVEPPVAPEFQFGNISLVIFHGEETRFRIALGWPIDEHPFQITMPKKLGGGFVPYFKAGLYFAFLAPEDLPDTFGHEGVPTFGNIFAGGLALGYGKKVEWEKGPLSFHASYEIDAQIEFYYVQAGAFTSGDYHWFCAQLSLIGSAGGGVDLAIVAIEFSIEVKITLAVAFETRHRSIVDLTLHVEAEASVRIAFITIHVKFEREIPMLGSPWLFGDRQLPTTKIKGPSPQAIDWAPIRRVLEARAAALKSAAGETPQASGPVPAAAFARREVVGPKSRLGGMMLRRGRPSASVGPLTARAEPAEADAPRSPNWLDELHAWSDRYWMSDGDAAGPLNVPLHFAIQTTAVSDEDGRWSPKGIGTLLIDIGLSGSSEESEVTSTFSQLCASLVSFLTHHFGADFEGIRKSLGWQTPRTDRSWVALWLDTLTFELRELKLDDDSAPDMRVAVFPMLDNYVMHSDAGSSDPGTHEETREVREAYFEFLAKSLIDDLETIDEQALDWEEEDPDPTLAKNRTPAEKSADADAEKAAAEAAFDKLTDDGSVAFKNAKRKRTTARAASTRARAMAASLKGKLDGARIQWARNPGSDSARDSVMVAHLEIAARKSLHGIAGNLSRLLLSGSVARSADRNGRFRGLYEMTGQQFDLVGRTFQLEDAATGETAETTIPDEMDYGHLQGPVLDWTGTVDTGGAAPRPEWRFGQLPPVVAKPSRFPLARRVNYSGEGGSQSVAEFPDDLRLAVERRSGDDPMLWASDTGAAQPAGGASLDDATPGWACARPALTFSVTLKRVEPVGDPPQEPETSDTDRAGAKTLKLARKTPLDDVVALTGAGEAQRALLGRLLDATGTPDIQELGVEMIARPKSDAPYVAIDLSKAQLVKTNLSTATGGATTGAPTPPPAGPYHAASGHADPSNWIDFLRLIWEASVVGTDGFYLRLKGAKLDEIFGGQKSLKVRFVVTTTSKPAKKAARNGATKFHVRGFHNAVVGDLPEGHVFAILARSAAVCEYVYVPNHPVDQPGLQIVHTVRRAPLDAAPSGTRAEKAAFDPSRHLRELYTVFNCKSGETPWSKPLHGVDFDVDGRRDLKERRYVKTVPLEQTGTEARYAGVGGSAAIDLRVADIFGNLAPSSIGPFAGRPCDLRLVYNDPIQALGDWPGTRCTYRVAPDSTTGAPTLELLLRFNTAAVLPPKGNSGHPDRDAAESETSERSNRIQAVRDDYRRVLAQLADANLDVALDSSIQDAPARTVIGTDLKAGDTSLKSALAAYVEELLVWLDRLDADPALKDAPEPATVRSALKRDFPVSWSGSEPGNLHELTVDVTFERRFAGTDAAAAKRAEDRWFTLPEPVEPAGERDIRMLLPRAKRVTSRVVPEQPKGAKTTGLAEFAEKFETAYADFDGKGGRLKVSTGVNSDPTSVHFGKTTIYAMRFSAVAGVSVRRSEATPLFSAPVPVNRHLVTAKVDSQYYSSIDMDRWAAEFLASVEDLFDPAVAPGIAGLATPKSDGYSRLAESKAKLAATIRTTLDWIYQHDYLGGTHDRPALDDAFAFAQETILQAMLHSLRDDYGTAAVVQIPMDVELTGDAAGAVDPSRVPNLFGPVETRGAQGAALPYSLSNAKLPMRRREQLTEWLNLLLNVKQTGHQNYLDLNLDFAIRSVEHDFQPVGAFAGYVPSSWLNFVLPEDPAAAEPRTGGNTLTVPVATDMTVPVPLRSFPPNPKLVGQKAQQTSARPSTLEEALVWDYSVDIAAPEAAQDALGVAIVFNEPVDVPLVRPKHTEAADFAGERQNLFEALAAYRHDTGGPGAAPDIGSADAVGALNRAIERVTGAWGALSARQIAERTARHAGAAAGADVETRNPERETWSFLAQWDNLHRQMSLTRGGNEPWPELEGYDLADTSDDGQVRRYSYAKASGAGAGGRPALRMMWRGLYVLGYQSAHAGAYVERNSHLAPIDDRHPDSDWRTNPAFVYRTETVWFAAPVVPLIRAHEVPVDAGAGLGATVASILDRIRTPHGPGTARDTAQADGLRFETRVDYSYRLLEKGTETLRPLQPVLMLQAALLDGGASTSIDPAEHGFADAAEAAASLAGRLVRWHAARSAGMPDETLDFAWTLFATKLGGAGLILPLVRIENMRLDATGAGWWR